MYDPDVCNTFHVSMHEAESFLAASCTNYLKMKDHEKKWRAQDVGMEIWDDCGFGSISPTEKPSTDPQDTPSSASQVTSNECLSERIQPWTSFFSYSASHWGYHYASAESSSDELDNAALELSTRPDILGHWSHHFRRSYCGYDNLRERPNALIVVAYFGQSSMARKLVSNDEYNSGCPLALTWAARMGHVDVVKVLIEHGTPIMGAVLDGRPAFSWATAGGFFEVIDTLLSHDEELVNEQDARGCCPLVLAARY